MTPLHALAFVFVLADAPSATPAPIASPTLSPAPSPTTSSRPTPAASSVPSESLTVRGRLFVITSTYLVFTTGDAVAMDVDARIAPALRLGQAIRVRFDPLSHHVRSVEAASGVAEQGEVDVAQVPREYVTISPASAHTNENAKTVRQAKIVAVAFVVRVPDDTPITDDVYLSTERSNFSPAEQKMNRIDARTWTTTLPLIEGTTLHYQYTRGNYANIERDNGGGVVAPRAIEAHEGTRTNDTVARWADVS
jgi:hypothetical protein